MKRGERVGHNPLSPQEPTLKNDPIERARAVLSGLPPETKLASLSKRGSNKQVPQAFKDFMDELSEDGRREMISVMTHLTHLGFSHWSLEQIKERPYFTREDEGRHPREEAARRLFLKSGDQGIEK